MLKTIKYPEQNEWKALLKRPYVDNSQVIGDVQMILAELKKEGDAAVKRYSEQCDKVRIDKTEVPSSALSEAEQILPKELKSAIKTAAKNIETFHAAQLLKEEVVETMPGVQCWRRSIGIEKVGLYIP